MTTNENKKEFDRSICMTFFGDCREHIKRLERNFGIEKAYQIQSAIIDYGLDGIKPTEDDILLYLPEPMLNQIDNNQAKRAQAFSSEDLEMSEKILVTHRDRPELSQEKLAKLLGISKGKVNKTLQKWKNGEYEGLINIDTNSNNNTNPNTYTNVTVTVTDQRDRLVEVTTDSPTAQTASTMPTEMDGCLNELSDFSYEDKVKLIDYWHDKHTYKEIAFYMNCKQSCVGKVIKEYQDNGNQVPEPHKEEVNDIPTMSGGYLTYSKEELFNMFTANGTATIDEIPWDSLRCEFAKWDVSPQDATQVLNEFKQRLTS